MTIETVEQALARHGITHITDVDVKAVPGFREACESLAAEIVRLQGELGLYREFYEYMQVLPGTPIAETCDEIEETRTMKGQA